MQAVQCSSYVYGARVMRSHAAALFGAFNVLSIWAVSTLPLRPLRFPLMVMNRPTAKFQEFANGRRSA